MKISPRFFAAILLVLGFSSCAFVEEFMSARKPAPELDYLDRGVKMDITTFFNGDLESFTITRDFNSKITDSSTSKINAKWEDNKGVIQEIFFDSNGKKDSRTWLVTANSDGTFDMIGHDFASPIEGKQKGNALQMNYSLLTKVDGVKQAVKFEDKIYLIDEKSAIKISAFKKKNGASGTKITALKKSGKTISSETKSSSLKFGAQANPSGDLKIDLTKPEAINSTPTNQ